MIDLCQNDAQLVFDNAAYMPSLQLLTKVLPVLDIQLWDVESFTDDTNVVGRTFGFFTGIFKHLGKATLVKQDGFIHHTLLRYKRTKRFG